MNIFFAFSYSSIFKNINFLILSCYAVVNLLYHLSTDKLPSKNAFVNRQPNYITTLENIKSSIFFKFFDFFYTFFIFAKQRAFIPVVIFALYNIYVSYTKIFTRILTADKISLFSALRFSLYYSENIIIFFYKKSLQKTINKIKSHHLVSLIKN